MHVIVIGCGKVGSSLARELVDKGHGVVIIDNDKQHLENANDIDCIKINGIPIDKDVLKGAGIEEADAVCAVTQDDNTNIMTAQVAKEIFKVKKVITRIFNPQSTELFEEFGLSTVCSTSLTVNAIYRSLQSEIDGDAHFIFGEEIIYSKKEIEHKYAGMDIVEYSKIQERHVSCLIRKGKMILSMPGMKIEKGDIAVIMSMQ
jgi:trk system potassium uptake protein TrkA